MAELTVELPADVAEAAITAGVDEVWAELHRALLGVFGEGTAAAVVVECPTVMDGTVLRWYLTEERALHRDEVLSASRNGVVLQAYRYLDSVPAVWVAEAHEAYRRMRRSQHADLSDLVTHRIVGGGPRRRVEPITPTEG